MSPVTVTPKSYQHFPQTFEQKKVVDFQRFSPLFPFSSNFANGTFALFEARFFLDITVSFPPVYPFMRAKMQPAPPGAEPAALFELASQSRARRRKGL